MTIDKLTYFRFLRYQALDILKAMERDVMEQTERLCEIDVEVMKLEREIENANAR